MIEDPAYPGIWSALSAAGARPRAIAVDDQGFDVARAARVPDARVAVLTPSHQFPLGMTLSLERRFALLDWAAEQNAWIIEDDYDSEFRYEGPPVSSLQGLDANGRVLYIGTFSKVLLPSLRLGYLVVPPQLVDAFRTALRFCGGQPSLVTQVGLADFIDRGHFTSHLRAMRKRYAERRDVLRRCLERQLGHRLRVRPDDGGMHLVAELLPGRGVTSDIELERRAAKIGMHCRPLSRYVQTRKSRNGLIMGFAGHTSRRLREAVDRLAKLVDAK